MISSTEAYFFNLHCESNICIFVLLTVVVNFNNFSTPLQPFESISFSKSGIFPFGNTTLKSTIFSVEIDVKSLIEGAIFLPDLSVEPSIRVSKKLVYGIVHVPIGNSVTRILSSAIFSYLPFIKNLFSSIFLTVPLKPS